QIVVDFKNAAAASPITLKSSLPALANNITIVGNGVAVTVIQPDTSVVTPFRLLPVAANGTVVLSNLGMSNGNAGSGNGGAIDNFGNLTLTNCNLFGNAAVDGGAVADEAGASLGVTGCTFSGNHSSDTNAPRGGGAIWNLGTLTIGINNTFS